MPASLPDTLPARLRALRGDDAIDPLHGRGELAYDLEPHWQGQGLATHRAVLDCGHAVRSLTRIQATVLDSNARSIAEPERLGMRREGLLHAYRRVRGQPRNVWMYAHLDGTTVSLP
ncbi:GNAT family N-acetyltransferase [Stenotrophomonas maltophilia]|nr:GNAT family N-acetyltransferase [Stenotrophomonas maltophilia]